MKESDRNSCVSVFVHNADELTEAFTDIWIQLINEKERNKDQNVVLQANVSAV